MDCSVYLYCKTIPIIESSCGMKFGPFNGGLKGHGVLLREAGLVNNTSTITNEWFKIYDFTAEHAGIVPDGDKMNVNVSRHWRIMKREEEDDIWCPLGPAENRIPRVDPDDGETTDDKREDRNDATEKEKEKEEEGDMYTSSSSIGSTTSIDIRRNNNNDAEVINTESRKRPESPIGSIIFSWFRSITETICTSVNAMYDEMKSKTAIISSRMITCFSCIANKMKKE